MILKNRSKFYTLHKYNPLANLFVTILSYFYFFITNIFVQGKLIQTELFYCGTLYQKYIGYLKRFKYIWNKAIVNNKATSIVKCHRR